MIRQQMKATLLTNQRLAQYSQKIFQKKLCLNKTWSHVGAWMEDWLESSWGIFSGVCLNTSGFFSSDASLWSARLPKMDLMSWAAAVRGFHLQSLFSLVARGEEKNHCTLYQEANNSMRKHSWKHNFTVLTKTSRSITIKLGKQASDLE